MTCFLSISVLDPKIQVKNGLQCYSCAGPACNNVVQCVGVEDHCFSGIGESSCRSDWKEFVALTGFYSSAPAIVKCRGTRLFSYNFGNTTFDAALHCCRTDGCNSPVQAENGLKCFTCADPQSTVCNDTLRCVGAQNRCFRGNGKPSRCTSYNTSLVTLSPLVPTSVKLAKETQHT
uniref:UPAR/Ly6 domain-containing protein n=1 Tax=Seriola lalandi dorsalis TaxID=1841481 RepID=A0A3B4XQN1_SERLL